MAQEASWPAGAARPVPRSGRYCGRRRAARILPASDPDGGLPCASLAARVGAAGAGPADPLAAGTTYRWIDRQGQVHYTDTRRRPHCLRGRRRAACAAFRRAIASTRGAAGPARCGVAPGCSEVAVDARDDGRCVDALYQLQVLAGQWRVYKPGPGDDRTYLHDRDRPAEIGRLIRERDGNCSEDPATLDSQRRRADELFQALSPECREAREKLQNMLRPTPAPPRRISRTSRRSSRRAARTSAAKASGSRTGSWCDSPRRHRLPPPPLRPLPARRAIRQDRAPARYAARPRSDPRSSSPGRPPECA